MNDRPHWKEDKEFQIFNKNLYENMFTFEETLKLAQFDSYQFDDTNEVLLNMKIEWTKLIAEWNEIEKIKHDDRSFGYVVLTYLFVVLPYERLIDPNKYFTHFEINQINIAYFYVQNTAYSKPLPFENLEELFNSGPIFPPAYQQWINNKYNKASWWITYMIYEKNNGFLPLIKSEQAVFNKNI
jgi:hypothetical protein